MLEIKCPKCGETIQLGKDAYNALLNEIEKEEVEKRLNVQVQQIEAKYRAEYALKENMFKSEKESEASELKQKIAVLEERLNNSKNETELAVTKALESAKEDLTKKENELIGLKAKLFQTEKQANEAAQKAKEQFESAMKEMNEKVARWKEYRVGDSTKDLGENLEQYCHDAFDAIRADAYPNAYFEKDNDSVKEEGEAKGTKGDFIFRDYSPDGIELVSILFDMKTEKDNTESKKTNEYHLKKLDSDRNKKGCEYAILVSTLEEDSELYNKGIVDVSHKYPKMFVVRPQFFLTIIGLIRNMAKSTFAYKKQVVEYQRENLDITHFEEAVANVVNKINDDYSKADKYYNEVDKMCDDIIKKVNTFREGFRIARNHLGTSVNRLPSLEVRTLTKNNPTMAQKFEELAESKKGKAL